MSASSDGTTQTLETTVQTLETHDYSIAEIARRMWPLIAAHKLLVALIGLMMTGVGLAMAVPPAITRYILDVAIPRGSMRLAVGAVAIFLLSQLMRMSLYYVAQRKVMWIREDIVFRLRSIGFRHLQRLCLRFHSRYSTGFLYDRVFERSICSVGTFFGLAFSQVALYLTSLVFALAFCLYYSPAMTGLIFFGALGYVLISRVMAPRIRERMLVCHNAHNWIAGYITDKLRGTKTIQAFALEDHTEADFDERVWPMQVKFIEAEREALKLRFVSEGLGYIVTALVYVCGAYAIFNWEMKIGELMMFVGYQAQLIGMLNQLTAVYGQFAMARAGFDQIFTVLDTQSTVVNKPDAHMPEEIAGEIEFQDVTFSYRQGDPVLRNVNCDITPGQTVALVGRSGGGKTTIANLLLRFYDPDTGRVLLDGRDIRDLPVRQYRSLFGVVLQDPFLFDDTIAANLRCARPDATDEEIEEALRKSCALDFVNNFPEGIYHRVGEGGAQLSGGQRQRIAIARCMLLRPRFLILDEATSALDNESERYIQQAFNALFENRTVFVIAHRLSTIRRANRILVMENGGVAEDGSFAELLEQGGIFHHLYTIATSSSERGIKIDEAGFA